MQGARVVVAMGGLQVELEWWLWYREVVADLNKKISRYRW
jgi:hypothetical protein